MASEHDVAKSRSRDLEERSSSTSFDTSDGIGIGIGENENENENENGQTSTTTADQRSRQDQQEAPEASTSGSHLHSTPLVELSLENITYAPITRSAAATGAGSRGAGAGILSGAIRKVLPGRRSRRSSSSSSSSSFPASPPNAGTGTVSGSGEIKSRKVILHDVSCQIKPYTLTAIMGPSGSGKSSLIGVAAGFCQSSDLIDASTIRANGSVGAPPKRLVSVVHQDDLLLPNLTVQETVAFAARLKNEQSTSKEEIATLVSATIAELGLSGVADSCIGSMTKRGISGGERKRLAVAVELVGKPSILLLDEPTSGLDSTTAYSLITTTKALARAGHSIAVVVHQPRTEIFNLFDELLLLSRGRVVYNGVPGGIKDYLESVPSVDKLPPQTGIADWLMDCISHDEKREGGGILANEWKEREMLNLAEAGAKEENGTIGSSVVLRRKHAMKRRLSSLVELHAEPKFKSSFWLQLRLLTRRSAKQQRGDRFTAIACIYSGVYTLFTGVLYWRLPDDTAHIYQRMSLLFFILITQSNGIVTSSMTLFSRECNLLKRERAKKMYGVLPYFLAKTLSDMTTSVILPCIYGIIIYWVAGLRPSVGHFFLFVLIYYLNVSTAQAVGLLISVAIPRLDVALLLAPVLMIFVLILAGFYVPLDRLNPAIVWASWASFARYGYSSLIINEFAGRTVECADNASVGEFEQCPFPGDSVLTEVAGLRGIWTNLWANVFMVIMFQVLTRVTTYIMLRRSK